MLQSLRRRVSARMVLRAGHQNGLPRAGASFLVPTVASVVVKSLLAVDRATRTQPRRTQAQCSVITTQEAQTLTTPDKIPVILDCDPGTDDAFALLLALAAPEIDLLAVTVAGGNVGLFGWLATGAVSLLGNETLKVMAPSIRSGVVDWP